MSTEKARSLSHEAKRKDDRVATSLDLGDSIHVLQWKTFGLDRHVPESLKWSTSKDHYQGGRYRDKSEKHYDAPGPPME